MYHKITALHIHPGQQGGCVEHMTRTTSNAWLDLTHATKSARGSADVENIISQLRKFCIEALRSNCTPAHVLETLIRSPQLDLANRKISIADLQERVERTNRLNKRISRELAAELSSIIEPEENLRGIFNLPTRAQRLKAWLKNLISG